MFLPWFLNCLCFVQQLVEIKLSRAGQTPCLPSITIACFWIIRKKMFLVCKSDFRKAILTWKQPALQRGYILRAWYRVWDLPCIRCSGSWKRRRAELSSRVLPLRETCYLLGALGLSGGEREMDQIVLCSCSGWDMALHVAVCNFSLVGVQGLICRGLVSCLTAALCVPCLAGPRTECSTWVQESQMCLWPWFTLSLKRQGG